MVVVSDEVPSYCGVGNTLNVKNVTLESVNDHVSSLSHIFDVAPIAFQAKIKVVTLADAIPDGIMGFMFSKFLMVPYWEILLQ